MDHTLPKHWLDYCKSEHKGFNCSIGPRGLGCGGCQTWTRLATCANLPFRFRVIDVLTLRVVDAPPDCPYVALSYVWGAAKVYKAYKADFQPRPDGASFLDLGAVADQIPQTVLDAIEVVKMLGARYLWVDALCIAQDDNEELKDTLPAMCLIYEAATVTIVAAFGSDANAGLPGARPGSRGAEQLTFSAQDITLAHAAPQLLDALADSAWKTRGWTFQEDRFSRRKIIFTGSHVYWKC
ncbi:heterokaryon incompatibility protein-domain-containing protein, partial [Immersiella caudata]